MSYIQEKTVVRAPAPSAGRVRPGAPSPAARTPGAGGPASRRSPAPSRPSPGARTQTPATKGARIDLVYVLVISTNIYLKIFFKNLTFS